MTDCLQQNQLSALKKFATDLSIEAPVFFCFGRKTGLTFIGHQKGFFLVTIGPFFSFKLHFKLPALCVTKLCGT
jgi:hypothetical protein